MPTQTQRPHSLLLIGGIVPPEGPVLDPVAIAWFWLRAGRQSVRRQGQLAGRFRSPGQAEPPGRTDRVVETRSHGFEPPRIDVDLHEQRLRARLDRSDRELGSNLDAPPTAVHPQQPTSL